MGVTFEVKWVNEILFLSSAAAYDLAVWKRPGVTLHSIARADAEYQGQGPFLKGARGNAIPEKTYVVSDHCT